MHPNDHNQRSKETTTTCGRAQAKANDPAPEQSSSSFFSADGRSEEKPSGELSPEDDAKLEHICDEFVSDPRQLDKARMCAKRRGMPFVLEQAEIVRLEFQEEKIRKPSSAFEAACDSPEGWKRPKPAIKPERKRKASLPASPVLDRWKAATTDEREEWLTKLGRDRGLAQYAYPSQECLDALENLFAHEPPEPESDPDQCGRQIAEDLKRFRLTGALTSK